MVWFRFAGVGFLAGILSFGRGGGGDAPEVIVFDVDGAKILLYNIKYFARSFAYVGWRCAIDGDDYWGASVEGVSDGFHESSS